MNPEFTILLHHHRFASNDTASSIQSQNKRTTFYSEKIVIKMNATMFSLFHSIKFSQFCALSDGGHSTNDTKGDLRDYIYMH